MGIWILIEVAVSAVGAYNIVKGAYNMYKDAETVKDQYREHQKITEEYLRTQGVKHQDPLTESQFDRQNDAFVVLSESQVVDPYNRT